MGEIEAAEGEITPEMDEALTINQAELQQKSLGYIEYIGHQDALTARIDEEIKRLQAFKKRTTKSVDYLKGKLLEAVELFGPYEADLHKIGTRKSTAVEVFDEEKLPNEYKVRKVVEGPDRAKIKDAIKQGENVPGAALVERQNLKIS